MLVACQGGNFLTAEGLNLVVSYGNSARVWSPSSAGNMVAGTTRCQSGRGHYGGTMVIFVGDDDEGDQACPPGAWFQRACDQSRLGVSVDLV